MSQCRHDKLFTYRCTSDNHGVRCQSCPTAGETLVLSFRAQRDAAEKERDAAQLALAKSQTRAAQLLRTAKYIARALRSLRHVKLDGIAEQYGLRTNGDWLGLFLDANDAHVQALGELVAQRERAAAAEAEVERQKAAVEKLLGEDWVWCDGCKCADPCSCPYVEWTPMNQASCRDPQGCRAARRAWAYGDTKEATTDAEDRDA